MQYWRSKKWGSTPIVLVEHIAQAFPITRPPRDEDPGPSLLSLGHSKLPKFQHTLKLGLWERVRSLTAQRMKLKVGLDGVEGKARSGRG